MSLNNQQLAEQLSLASQGKKKCSKCGMVKQLSEFFKRKANRDGLDGFCKSCQQEKNTRWEKQNPVKTQTMYMICAARTRAKSKGMEFNIDVDYVRSLVTSNCPVFGVPLEWSCCREMKAKPLPNSPSLDRIDNNKGYVRGNVWIISHRANAVKNSASLDEIKMLANALKGKC